MGRLPNAALILAYLSAATPTGATAADLQVRSSLAYDAYLEEARRAFVSRVRSDAAAAPRRDGVLFAGPARQDGIIGVPGALVHHWIGGAFVRGVALRDVVAVSLDYPAYSTVYTPIIASTLLAQEGDTYRVLTRLREGAGGISAVLEIRSTVEYRYPTDDGAFALSNADEIREVRNAGDRDEHLLPAGRDSGYLWRASTFTHFLALEDGVYVEMETVGLSRRFPPLLGWIIEPFARRLGRRSVETSLQEFLAAVRMRRAP